VNTVINIRIQNNGGGGDFSTEDVLASKVGICSMDLVSYGVNLRCEVTLS
jgi:hypothetical protein